MKSASISAARSAGSPSTNTRTRPRPCSQSLASDFTSKPIAMLDVTPRGRRTERGAASGIENAA